MVPPPAGGGDKGAAAGTPPAAVTMASPGKTAAAGGSHPSDHEQRLQQEGDVRQQQQDEQQQHEQQQASGNRSDATAAGQAAAPAKRRGKRSGASYHQTFLPTSRAFLKELTPSNLNGKDILIPNWLYHVWAKEVGFPAGGDAGDGPAALKLTCPTSGRSWEVGLGPHMGGMRLRQAATVRDMLQVLRARIGGGMLFTMEEEQPDLSYFSMAVRVFPRWSCKDPAPVELPGEPVSVSTSRRPGERSVPQPRVVPRPATSSHKRKRRGAGEQWDSGSEAEQSDEEEGMLGGAMVVDGPSGLARSRRNGAGSRLAALLHHPSPELSTSEQSGSEEGEEEEGEEEEGEGEQEESEEEWAQQQAWDVCRTIVRSLLAHSDVKLYFGEPVKEQFAPGYYQQISRPMDLGTVLAKLARGAYESVYDLQDDVRLVFGNCRKYNSQGHPVRQLGDATAQQFERLWRLKRVEQLWLQQQGPGSGSEPDDDDEMSAPGIGAFVTWGGSGWMAEATYGAAEGEPTRVRVRGLASAKQAEEAADLLALWCWQQQDPQARQACMSRARLGGSVAPAGLPGLYRDFREYAVSAGPGRMPRVWALAQLPRAHHVERYVRLAFKVKPPPRNAGSLASGAASDAPSEPAAPRQSPDGDSFEDDDDDDDDAVAALMAVAKQAAEGRALGLEDSEDDAAAAGSPSQAGEAGAGAALAAADDQEEGQEQQAQQQRQQEQEQRGHDQQQQQTGTASVREQQPASGQPAQPPASPAARPAAAAPAPLADGGASAASAALAESSRAAAQRWLQRAQASFAAPLDPAEADPQRRLLPLQCLVLAGYGGEALQAAVERWAAVPGASQEDVYDMAALAVHAGEGGCQGLEEDLRMVDLGGASPARAAPAEGAVAGGGAAQPFAAAALRRMQERAVQAFAEAGQDSSGMLAALRRVATMKWGGQLLKDTVLQWASLPVRQQQAAFDALLVATAHEAWQHVEARLRLALEVSQQE
ncbi:hypothetical protein ABPG75_008806 [Micractinium tetrahymenae]